MFSQRRKSAPSPASEAYRALKAAADKVSGLFVGPMPVEQFLNQFVPARADAPVTSDVFEELASLPQATDTLGKDQMMSRIVSGLAKLLPSWLVAHPREPDSICGMSVDIGLFIDVDPSGWADPFHDSDPTSILEYSFEGEGETALSRQTMDASCVGAMAALQSRTHTFSILISGTSARLLRWDASGVLVTRSFSYVDTNWLIEFLWRFDALSPSERGLDTSICPLDTPWPTHLAPEDVLECLKGQQSPSSALPRHRCFAIMKIPDRDAPSTEHDFLVSWPPRYTKSTPFGRATRPMFAYDIKARKLVFAKQYWRVDDSQKEGEVYRRLADHNVRHLPVFGAGNDVREIGTVTQTFEPSEKRKGWYHHIRPLTKYRLYRMSLNTIGTGLSQFKSTRQLVTAVRDAMICHDDAYFNAGILHGDISPGNILIHPEGGGLLTDWDSSIDVKASEQCGPPRRGTWQFMSARLLRCRSGPHELQDDRESAFWVLLWIALVHTSYTSPRPLDSWMNLFDERLVDKLGAVGGDCKFQYFRFPIWQDTIDSTSSPCFNTLIPRLKDFFAIRYGKGFTDPRLPSAPLLIAAGRYVPSIAEYDAFQDRMTKLSEKGALIDVLNEALDDPTLWPEVDDPALPDISLHGKPLSRKRSADVAGLQEAPNPSKSPRKSPPPPVQPLAATSSPTTRILPLPKPRKKLVVPPSDRVLRPRPGPPAPAPAPAALPTTRKKTAKPAVPKSGNVSSKKRGPAKPRPSRRKRA